MQRGGRRGARACSPRSSSPIYPCIDACIQASICLCIRRVGGCVPRACMRGCVPQGLATGVARDMGNADSVNACTLCVCVCVRARTPAYVYVCAHACVLAGEICVDFSVQAASRPPMMHAACDYHQVSQSMRRRRIFSCGACCSGRQPCMRPHARSPPCV
jgi:hypothetical protein